MSIQCCLQNRSPILSQYKLERHTQNISQSHDASQGDRQQSPSASLGLGDGSCDFIILEDESGERVCESVLRESVDSGFVLFLPVSPHSGWCERCQRVL